MYSVQTLSRKVKAKLVRCLHTEQWVIGARVRGDSQLPTDLKDCTFLVPPTGMHYADPFVVRHCDSTFVFFESWHDSDMKGTIKVAGLDSQGCWSLPEPALERPYHLSYPHVFSWRGEIYMLPETRHNRTIELYRATNFPRTWELTSVLLNNVDAVDTTLFEERGRWWMFTAGLGDSLDRLQRLSVFYADSPLGPWRPHPSNPVVTDMSRGRSAGNLFRLGKELIRPGQDCRSRYGYAISWNRIDLLTETAYHESLIGNFQPTFRSHCAAIHTFNQDGRWQVFDAKRLCLRKNRMFSRAQQH
jgi:hypothetical protein